MGHRVCSPCRARPGPTMQPTGRTALLHALCCSGGCQGHHNFLVRPNLLANRCGWRRQASHSWRADGCRAKWRYVRSHCDLAGRLAAPPSLLPPCHLDPIPIAAGLQGLGLLGGGTQQGMTWTTSLQVGWPRGAWLRAGSSGWSRPPCLLRCLAVPVTRAPTEVL